MSSSLRPRQLRTAGALALLLRTAASFTLLLVLPLAAGAGERLAYPKARTVDQVDEMFGTRVADPYRWLENVDDPEVQRWVEEENALTRSVLDRIPYRDAVAKRLTELL